MVRKFISTLVISGFVAFGAGVVSADDNACTISKGDNAVGAACKKGGRKEAKKVMKAMVATAKKAGKKWECDSCHKNEENWALTGDGEKLFKEMLALQK
jgi:hypothetical protein